MFTASLRRNRRFRVIRPKHARIFALAWVVALLLPAGAAYAYWTAGGTGGGRANGLTAQALVVSAGNPTADLFPGNFGAVAFSVNNPNPYPVTVTSASTVSVGTITNQLAGGACTASDFSLATGTISGGLIPANSTGTVTLNNALKMLSTAGDGCQGAHIPITATLTGTQS